jgi:hypothetical protein
MEPRPGSLWDPLYFVLPPSDPLFARFLRERANSPTASTWGGLLPSLAVCFLLLLLRAAFNAAFALYVRAGAAGLKVLQQQQQTQHHHRYVFMGEARPHTVSCDKRREGSGRRTRGAPPLRTNERLPSPPVALPPPPPPCLGRFPLPPALAPSSTPSSPLNQRKTQQRRRRHDDGGCQRHRHRRRPAAP